MKKSTKLYMFTDENISSMTEKLDLKDKDILTVTASGDQALNFLLEGAKSISLFDDNPYSEAYFYLKKALIENLSYNDFLEFFFPRVFSKKEYLSKEKFNLAKDSLPEGKIKDYWTYMFNSCSKKEIENIFVNRTYNRKDIIKRNKYLQSEENYNKLKEILKGIDKVDFNHIDILHQILYSQNKVDFIYLSEILNFISAENQTDYLKKIKSLTLNIAHNVKEEGIVAVSYMHCYLDEYWHLLNNNIQAIFSEPNNKDSFLNKDCQKIDFKGGYIPDSPVIKDRDALIIYKTKKKTKSK